jgi:hypothetical protein
MVSWGVLGGPGGSGLALGALIGSGWLRLLACAAARNSGAAVAILAPAAILAQLSQFWRSCRNSGAAVAILALARKLGVDFGVDFSVPGCAGLDCSCGGNRRWW